MFLPGNEDGAKRKDAITALFASVNRQQRHLQQLIARQILQEIPRYHQVPRDELEQSVGCTLTALLDYLQNREAPNFTQFIHERTQRRFRQHFTLQEMSAVTRIYQDTLINSLNLSGVPTEALDTIQNINHAIATAMTTIGSAYLENYAQLGKAVTSDLCQYVLLQRAALNIFMVLNPATILDRCAHYLQQAWPDHDLCIWSNIHEERNWSCTISKARTEERMQLFRTLLTPPSGQSTPTILQLIDYEKQMIDVPNLAVHPLVASHPELQQFTETSLILLPLRKADQLFGVIIFLSPLSAHRSQATLELIRWIAAITAISLDHARRIFDSTHYLHELKQAMDNLQQTTARLKRSQEISQAISGTFELDTLLRNITKELSVSLNLPQVGIFRIDDGERIVVMAGRGIDPIIQEKLTNRPFQHASDIVRELISTPRSMVLYGNDIVKYISEEIRNVIPLATVLVIPLVFHGQMIGYIVLADPEKERTITSDDLAFLDSVAGQIASTLEAVRILTERQHRLKQLDIVNRIARELMTSLDEVAIEKAYCRELPNLLPFVDVIIISRIEHNPAGQEILALKRAYGISEDKMQPLLATPINESPIAKLLETKHSLRFDSLAELSQSASVIRQIAENTSLTSLSISPIWYRDKLYGVLYLGNRTQHRWSQDESNFVEISCSLLGFALTNSSLYHAEVESAKHLESALQVEQQASQHLRELTQAKIEFIENVTHEFKTPLTTILGYASLLNSHDDPSVRDVILRIERSANRLRQMIGDMLDLSRIEVGRLPLTPQACSIQAVTREVVDSLQITAKEKGLDLHLDLPS
ncbi:MAG TPA: GAF domain-containing protein, partial [Armatimonadota bacterium]|nr:GAF domain-containing protein [Armatimonadota bacterium]